MLRKGFLVEGENLLYESRATKWFFFVTPVLLMLAVGSFNLWIWSNVSGSPLSGLGSPPFPGYGSGMSSNSIPVMLGLFLLIVAVVFLLVHFLRYIRTVYVLTSNRIIRGKGILSKDYDEIQLNQIRGVDMHQTIGQRLLGYGTLRVSTEGSAPGGLGNDDWRGLPRPNEFSHMIEQALVRLRTA
jgi:hypothetical protein